MDDRERKKQELAEYIEKTCDDNKWLRGSLGDVFLGWHEKEIGKLKRDFIFFADSLLETKNREIGELKHEIEGLKQTKKECMDMLTKQWEEKTKCQK